MRQTRLSLGCQDWQQIIETVGATAAAVLLKLRLLMRSMGTSEVQLKPSELATALHLTEEQVRDGIRAIVENHFLAATEDAWDVITFVSDQEAAAMRERAKKAAKKSGEAGRQIDRASFWLAFFLRRGNSPGKFPGSGRSELQIIQTRGGCHGRREVPRRAGEKRKISPDP